MGVYIIENKIGEKQFPQLRLVIFKFQSFQIGSNTHSIGLQFREKLNHISCLLMLLLGQDYIVKLGLLGFKFN